MLATKSALSTLEIKLAKLERRVFASQRLRSNQYSIIFGEEPLTNEIDDLKKEVNNLEKTVSQLTDALVKAGVLTSFKPEDYDVEGLYNIYPFEEKPKYKVSKPAKRAKAPKKAKTVTFKMAK